MIVLRQDGSSSQVTGGCWRAGRLSGQATQKQYSSRWVLARLVSFQDCITLCVTCSDVSTQWTADAYLKGSPLSCDCLVEMP